MKTLLTILLLIVQIEAASLIETVSSVTAKASKNIENGYKPLSEDEKRLHALAGTQKRPIDNISIKVIERKVTQNVSITAAYTPPLKYNNIIDNKEHAGVRLEYRF